jgi:aurora kinase
MEVANLEAAFERITVTDENDEQISASTTSYHKTKVCMHACSVPCHPRADS